MFTHKLMPRFSDTDALGHIHNAAIVVWFEEGRTELFKTFVPSLNPKKWNLIIARIEVDFVSQGQYTKEVEVKSFVEKIGNTSLVLNQECFQNGATIAKAKVILVHFDYDTNKPASIPEEIKSKLIK